VFGSFFYDRILHRFSWRWKLLVITLSSLIGALFLVSKRPIAWIVLHLTIDPQTGYFRMATWDLGLAEVARSPILGRGFTEFTGPAESLVYIAYSVDAVWLVEALRYGLPAVACLILTIFLPFFTKNRSLTSDPYMRRCRTAFSLVLVLMSVVGLTVHFWNADWIFFSLCMGIRASLAEFDIKQRRAGRPVNSISNSPS
jgi:hypothetical protein